MITKFLPLAELFLDIPIIFISWIIYKKITPCFKKLILFFILSVVGLFFTDLGFCIFFYFFNQRIPQLIYMLPFLIFLLGQIIFWIGINLENIYKNIEKSFIMGLFIFFNLVALGIFILTTKWKIGISSLLSFYDISTTLIEFTIFDLALICVICSKNLAIDLISTAIAILLSTNIWEKYLFDSGLSANFNYSEFIWLSGQLMLIFGLLKLSRSDLNNINWAYSITKIKSQISLWLFMLMNLSYLIFYFIGYFENLINKNSLMSFSFSMMISMIIIIFIAKSFGDLFEKPFCELKNNIVLLSNENNMHIDLTPNLFIDEFVFLQRFIKNAFEVQAQRNNERLKLSNLALSVAHDIRSPIAVMEICLKMFEENIPEDSIKIFKSAIQNVREIANNLLMQHRTESKSSLTENLFPINKNNVSSPIRLIELVQEIISLKKLEWSGRACELIFNFSEDSKIINVNANPIDIRRLISNLLNNSIEACNHEAKIEINITNDSNVISIEISDNGNGIPENKIAECLNGKSTKHPGKGIGLSSAKEYMESINGNLVLISKPGEGTTIKLNFIKLE